MILTILVGNSYKAAFATGILGRRVDQHYIIISLPKPPPQADPKARNHLGSEVMSSEALLEYPALFCPTRWHGFLTLQLGGEHLR